MASTDESSLGAPASSPSLPWKIRIKLWLLFIVTEIARRSDYTVNRRLLNFIQLILRTPPRPSPVMGGGVKSSDVTVDPTRNLWFRLFTPTDPNGAQLLPVIFFFHGGGFWYMSPAARAFDSFCRQLAMKLPAVVLSVNYRHTPEHRFPSQYDDGFDVLSYIDQHHSLELPPNADLRRSFLAGDSAGANLAHHVAVRTCTDPMQNIKIIGLISMQPFFGGEQRTESEKVAVRHVSRTDWVWKVFLPEGENRDHWAVNVSGPNAVDISSLEKFPATIVFTGGFDQLKGWQEKYYEWLRRSGKDVELMDFPNMVHGFYAFQELPETDQLVVKIKDFVSKRVVMC